MQAVCESGVMTVLEQLSSTVPGSLLPNGRLDCRSAGFRQGPIFATSSLPLHEVPLRPVRHLCFVLHFANYDNLELSVPAAYYAQLSNKCHVLLSWRMHQ